MYFCKQKLEIFRLFFVSDASPFHFSKMNTKNPNFHSEKLGFFANLFEGDAVVKNGRAVQEKHVLTVEADEISQKLRR